MDSSELLKLRKQLTLINETVSNEIYNLGDSLFEQIVIKLNDALDADYTFIGELNDSKTEFNTISLANKDGLMDNFSYEVKDTPCEFVVGQTPCSYPKDITLLFPKDQLLVDMGIEAYIGISLYDSKSKPTGILVCLFKEAISDINTYEGILLIFASRAGAELEHMKLYTSLDEHKKELEHKVLKRTKELNQKNKELEVSNKELGLAVSKLSEAQNQLIHSEKMASLGILTAGVAHEINNPLNFILGGYTGLKNHFEEINTTADHEINFFLNSIHTGVKRASKIIDSLSQFSRSTDSFDENCDIHKILDDCLIMLDISIKNKIDIKKEYTNSKINIEGNLGKLYQVFLNILNNSIQAIESKGKILVQTNLIDSSVEIRITDTGYGISEQNLSKILNPFYTTKQPGEGTGLGLSITFSIIKNHMGSLEFESKEDEYTTVIVKLPIKTA
jgi:two-component system NtrC family sensor kinase